MKEKVENKMTLEQFVEAVINGTDIDKVDVTVSVEGTKLTMTAPSEWFIQPNVNSDLLFGTEDDETE